jgi:hypothetical protein
MVSLAGFVSKTARGLMELEIEAFTFVYALRRRCRKNKRSLRFLSLSSPCFSVAGILKYLARTPLSDPITIAFGL